MKLIELKDVSVIYDGNPALLNVSLDINSTDFMGVIGPNGGGKTSLVKAILGLTPFTGEIKFADEIADKSSIGYLPQINNFDKSFPISVKETVLSGLQRRLFSNKFSKEEIALAESVMELVGVTGLTNKHISQLSGGELQRVLLCRSLVSSPRLLILDEPANFVDNKFEKELYEILKKLNENIAIIMVSHDLGTITSYVKSVVCVNRTAHRHDTNNLTSEMLDNYNCPIQIVSHGDIPHTVLNKH